MCIFLCALCAFVKSAGVCFDLVIGLYRRRLPLLLIILIFISRYPFNLFFKICFSFYFQLHQNTFSSLAFHFSSYSSQFQFKTYNLCPAQLNDNDSIPSFAFYSWFNIFRSQSIQQHHSLYDWCEERFEVQSIADDILSKYVPAHVNIFYRSIGCSIFTFHSGCFRLCFNNLISSNSSRSFLISSMHGSLNIFRLAHSKYSSVVFWSYGSYSYSSHWKSIFSLAGGGWFYI